MYSEITERGWRKSDMYKGATGGEAIVSWLKDNNANGDVTVHTFLFGKDAVATKTLKTIAKQHGGTFKPVSLDE